MVQQQCNGERLERILRVVMATREAMPSWVRERLPHRVSRVAVELATGYATIYYVDFDDQHTASFGDYLPPELLRELIA